MIRPPPISTLTATRFPDTTLCRPERDYTEYGYEFGTAPQRLRALGEALPRIRDRLAKLNPSPVGSLPLLVGGSGEKVTLRLVAQHADAWNAFGPAASFAHKNAVHYQWGAEVGRDRQSGGEGKGVSGRVGVGGARRNKK